jgi:aminoglycoside phosphotransferase (APT) family kinase protein
MTWSPPVKGSRHDLDGVREALRGWLADRLGGRDVQVSPLVAPKANGVSNETLFADAVWGGAQEQLVVRLQTDDPLYLDDGVDRQFDVYAAVAGHPGVLVPRLLGREPDASVLGTPFYVMYRVDGLVPGDNPHFTSSGWVRDAAPANRERLWRSAVEQLVAVHRVSPDAVAFLASPDSVESGLEQDLAYWRRSYRWAAGSESYPVMAAAERWLLDNVPPDAPTGLSWGDARVENMVFRDFRVAALLDPESASLAGPVADLAWWALMEKGERLPGIGTPRETIALWEELSGRRAEHLHYYLVLCAFRLAAVYIRLAAQLEQRGQLEPARKDLARTSEKMQLLALLLDLEPPCPLTVTLPDVL